jgi:hypothetical protein
MCRKWDKRRGGNQNGISLVPWMMAKLVHLDDDWFGLQAGLRRLVERNDRSYAREGGFWVLLVRLLSVGPRLNSAQHTRHRPARINHVLRKGEMRDTVSVSATGAIVLPFVGQAGWCIQTTTPWNSEEWKGCQHRGTLRYI